MDKVWFKLRQTHYCSGPEEVILAGDGDDSQAPICLGHCIPDLRHLDFPINRGAITAFPTRMKVFPTQSIDFKWEETRASENDLSLATGAPIAAAMGLLTVKASIRFAFKKAVENHEMYQRLDTYIVQPNRHYVDDCLQTEALQNYIRGKKTWSFSMITGIKVARTGKRSTGESSGVGFNGGPEVDVPTVATLEATGGIERGRTQKAEGEVSDFVWAVRLAKVHQGFLMHDWSIDPYTHKATFGLEEGEQVDVGKVVRSEGLSPEARVFEDEKLGEAVVIDGDNWDSSCYTGLHADE